MPSKSSSSAPNLVLLFSGHRIDAPDRASPRFTPAMLPAATRRIAQELADLKAGPADLALCQAAAGGDLLFLEACQTLGVHCKVMLPLDEPAFIEASILGSIDGPAWLDRWTAVKANLADPPITMAAEPSRAGDNGNPYERCNRWMLETALAYGPEKLHFLCLWDGKVGDGAGGVQHMADEIHRHHASFRWIDTHTLA